MNKQNQEKFLKIEEALLSFNSSQLKKKCICVSVSVSSNLRDYYLKKQNTSFKFSTLESNNGKYDFLIVNEGAFETVKEVQEVYVPFGDEIELQVSPYNLMEGEGENNGIKAKKIKISNEIKSIHFDINDKFDELIVELK